MVTAHQLPPDAVTLTADRLGRLPQRGVDKPLLLARMKAMKSGDAKWKEGKCFSLVYFAGEDHHRFLAEAHDLFLAENGLNPMAFKSLKEMETDVVRMTASLFHGDDATVGTMTSGGTESLLLAVKTYRDLARKKRPWIRKPEMVLPESAHVALDKAAHYFGVKPRYVKLGADHRVDLAALKKAVNRNTVMIVCSAPQYPHGVIDPVEQIATFAEKKGIPLHVDACIGGFVLPFAEQLGHRVPLWDFRVPGVTSISADLHKYGYAAKGASVLLYKAMDYLQHQFFISTDWPGGIYASPSIPGTRPGGPIAAAWAAMLALGEDGYRGLIGGALEATKKIVDGLGKIEGVRVLGKPDATLVAWTTTERKVDIYAVADVLEDAGWHIDRQQRPPSIHCTMTSNHLPIIDDYLGAVATAIEIVRADPSRKSRGNAAMYGMAAKVPFRGMVGRTVLKVMTGMYGADK